MSDRLLASQTAAILAKAMQNRQEDEPLFAKCAHMEDFPLVLWNKVQEIAGHTLRDRPFPTFNQVADAALTKRLLLKILESAQASAGRSLRRLANVNTQDHEDYIQPIHLAIGYIESWQLADGEQRRGNLNPAPPLTRHKDNNLQHSKLIATKPSDRVHNLEKNSKSLGKAPPSRTLQLLVHIVIEHPAVDTSDAPRPRTSATRVLVEVSYNEPIVYVLRLLGATDPKVDVLSFRRLLPNAGRDRSGVPIVIPSRYELIGWPGSSWADGEKIMFQDLMKHTGKTKSPEQKWDLECSYKRAWTDVKDIRKDFNVSGQPAYPPCELSDAGSVEAIPNSVDEVALPPDPIGQSLEAMISGLRSLYGRDDPGRGPIEDKFLSDCNNLLAIQARDPQNYRVIRKLILYLNQKVDELEDKQEMEKVNAAEKLSPISPKNIDDQTNNQRSPTAPQEAPQALPENQLPDAAAYDSTVARARLSEPDSQIPLEGEGRMWSSSPGVIQRATADATSVSHDTIPASSDDGYQPAVKKMTDRAIQPINLDELIAKSVEKAMEAAAEKMANVVASAVAPLASEVQQLKDEDSNGPVGHQDGAGSVLLPVVKGKMPMSQKHADRLEHLWSQACREANIALAMPDDIQGFLLMSMTSLDADEQLTLRQLMVKSCGKYGIDAFNVKMSPEAYTIIFCQEDTGNQTKLLASVPPVSPDIIPRSVDEEYYGDESECDFSVVSVHQQEAKAVRIQQVGAKQVRLVQSLDEASDFSIVSPSDSISNILLTDPQVEQVPSQPQQAPEVQNNATGNTNSRDKEPNIPKLPKPPSLPSLPSSIYRCNDESPIRAYEIDFNTRTYRRVPDDDPRFNLAVLKKSKSDNLPASSTTDSSPTSGVTARSLSDNAPDPWLSVQEESQEIPSEFRAIYKAPSCIFIPGLHPLEVAMGKSDWPRTPELPVFGLGSPELDLVKDYPLLTPRIVRASPSYTQGTCSRLLTKKTLFPKAGVEESPELPAFHLPEPTIAVPAWDPFASLDAEEGRVLQKHFALAPVTQRKAEIDSLW
ncbi:hypothetical protein ABW21_db0202018 [Orbilia brochopaga]|nr:hypothetical protein ABW21_db0202018 [Drechslerella brochopaga]